MHLVVTKLIGIVAVAPVAVAIAGAVLTILPLVGAIAPVVAIKAAPVVTIAGN